MTNEEADAVDLSLRDHYVKLQKKGLRRHALKEPHVQLRGPRLPLYYGPVLEPYRAHRA